MLKADQPVNLSKPQCAYWIPNPVPSSSSSWKKVKKKKATEKTNKFCNKKINY